jgi:hypothetical protein
METLEFFAKDDNESLRHLEIYFMSKENFYWFIENKDTNLWWCEGGVWTNDPHKCMKWDTQHKALTYCAYNCPFPERVDFLITEHEFVDNPK